MITDSLIDLRNIRKVIKKLIEHSEVPTFIQKIFLKPSRFPRGIRFGCKPNLPGLGLRRMLFPKLILMIVFCRYEEPSIFGEGIDS